MKKISSVVLAVLMAVGMMMAVLPASAAEVATVTFTVETTEVKSIAAGESFTLAVSTSAADSIAAVEVKLWYDKTVLEPTASTVEGYLADFAMANINLAPKYPETTDPDNVGEIAISAMNLTGVASAGETIATLTFTALVDINENVVVDIFKANASSESAVPYDIATVDGGVKIVLPTTGVVLREDGYYYVNTDGSVRTGKFWVTDAGANGYVAAGFYYADETGRFYNNEFYTMDDGAIYYMENGQPTKQRGVIEVNGDLYAISSIGSVNIGVIWITAAGSNGLVTEGYCYTDETGRFYNNEFVDVDGTTYYMLKGQPVKGAGLVEIDGERYYIGFNGLIATGKIWVTTTNDLDELGWYYTDETGRFYNNEFRVLEDGETYYMVHGKPDKGTGGIREIDGDLYYITWKGSVLTGKIWVTNGNGYSDYGTHYTDETGRFYNNEFVTFEDGTIYYMVKGRPMQNGGGIEKINGELYYVTWNGTVLTGEIWVTTTNGYSEYGTHYTDETGRFYNNEFVTLDDGNIYYIVNGRIYNTPGVIEVDGGLYYITWEGPVDTGEVYVTYNNGIIETTGKHYADETGRFYDEEFVTLADGYVYYIVKGAVYSVKGVLEIDGDYYYIAWDNHVVVNQKISITATNTNGHDIAAGYYYTDAQGRIIF